MIDAPGQLAHERRWLLRTFLLHVRRQNWRAI